MWFVAAARRRYPGVNRAMAEAYRSGMPVLFFPEGTTTDGSVEFYPSGADSSTPC